MCKEKIETIIEPSAWVRSMYSVRQIWDCTEKWQSCAEPVYIKFAVKNLQVFIWLAYIVW